MAKPALLAIDQGTTSSRAIVFELDGTIHGQAQEDFPQLYPSDGWVEHSPNAIWESTAKVVRAALRDAKKKRVKPISIGITNQRETVIVWDRATGKPIYNAIVWQDRRTADICKTLIAEGHEPTVQAKTGLLLDPYFSATKIAWILDHVPGARERAERGELAAGTIDTFLIWHLTGGNKHATDATNASRTALFNIETQQWDDSLLYLFRVPRRLLPEVLDCAADFGTSTKSAIGVELPIRGVAGDQQAAAIGQACYQNGSIKSTYGTGCFAILNTGNVRLQSRNRLLSTVAYRLNGETSYAIEGSLFVAGAAIQWLRDELGVIESSPDTERLAEKAAQDSQVVLVPAFTGLGAPHWSPTARAALFGMTRATGPAELAKAALEGIALQTAELLDAMAQDGLSPQRLRIDGGMAANRWFAQALSDTTGLPVDRPTILETTALGAAYLAALGSGLIESLSDIGEYWQLDESFTSKRNGPEREQKLAHWQRCVSAVLTLANEAG